MQKNKKRVIIITISLAILVLIGFVIINFAYQKNKTRVFLNPRNCTYSIQGENITLKDGYAENGLIPDSTSKTITQYFGNEVSGDFNGDGLTDSALILTQNMGGSGTFFYVTVALADINGCKGTNAAFLGDRISPQSTEVQNGKIIVNYADRKIDDSMVAFPSIGITKQYVVGGMTLKDVTPEESQKEQSCLLSGGTIRSLSCCNSTSDFPNLCLIGACGCSSTNSHQVKSCDCGNDKCFDGKECNRKN